MNKVALGFGLFSIFGVGVLIGGMWASSTSGDQSTLTKRAVEAQRDINYLTKSGCKSIVLTAINLNNEVKEVKFVKFDRVNDNGLPEAAKEEITFIMDGNKCTYTGVPFMERVLKVECRDDF